MWLSDTVPFYCYVGTLPSSSRINANCIIKHCLKYAKIWVSSNLSFPHKERNENSVLTRKNTPVGIYFLKVNNRNTKTKCEICSKLTIKITERRRSNVSIVNFGHVNADWRGVCYNEKKVEYFVPWIFKAFHFKQVYLHLSKLSFSHAFTEIAHRSKVKYFFEIFSKAFSPQQFLEKAAHLLLI